MGEEGGKKKTKNPKLTGSPRPETRNLLPLLTWGKKENGFRSHSLFPFTKRGTFKAVSENVLGSLRSIFQKRMLRGLCKILRSSTRCVSPQRGSLGGAVHIYLLHTREESAPWCACVCVYTGVHCTHVNSTHTGDIYLHRCVYHRVLIKRFTCWWVLPKTWPVGLCSVVPYKWLNSVNSFKWCWCKWLCMWKGAFAWGVGAVYLVDRQCPRKYVGRRGICSHSC